MMAVQSTSMQMTVLLGIVLSYTTIVNAGRMMGETNPGRSNSNSLRNFSVRGSRRSLQMEDKGCPKEYSLFHCEDPSLVFEISCNWDTCQWDLTQLDPKVQPASCSAISIADPLSPTLLDAVKPCAIWSIMFGEHKSASPTVSCKLSVCLDYFDINFRFLNNCVVSFLIH